MSLTDHFLFGCLAHFDFFVVTQGTQRFGCEFFMSVALYIKLLVEVRLYGNKLPKASKIQVLNNLFRQHKISGTNWVILL